jgi:hypothetical protein
MLIALQRVNHSTAMISCLHFIGYHSFDWLGKQRYTPQQRGASDSIDSSPNRRACTPRADNDAKTSKGGSV